MFKQLSLILIPLFAIFYYSFASSELVVNNVLVEKHDWAYNTKINIAELFQSVDENFTVSTNISNDQNQTQISTKTNNQVSTQIEKQIKTTKSPNEKFKIFVIGDSMAQGLEPHFKKLSKEYNCEVITKFKIGSSTFYWSNEALIMDELASQSPDLVLIVLGSNEWQGSSNPKLKRSAKKLIENMTKNKFAYIWIGPPVKNAQKYNEMLQMVADSKNIFDYTDLNVSRAKDNIHPTPKGFLIWSKQILDKLHKEQRLEHN